ncbi:MAG: biotin--[acetyl-CoA-carboxylase] ligase [Lachnospiraceae bacterium]|nr:biotin--[acetyl-CoA-carboxylase] ligase [Lachnospiraceae bacterium]
MVEKKIGEYLQTKWAAGKVIYKQTTVSTNEDAKQFAGEGAEHGLLVIADAQSGGKGRRGRSWQSEPETTISMTLLCRPQFTAEKASMLTLVMGLAVAEAISELTGVSASIKWPNDIVVNHKKVCGILTELGTTRGQIDYLIVGVGINVNNGITLPSADVSEKRRFAFGEELADTATSLWFETGVEVSREKLIAAIMEKFEQYYEKFVQDLNLQAMLDVYNSRLVGAGGEVRVLDPQGEYIGISRGIDAKGNLLVEVSGDVKKVYAGEVSVRGLYGYV